MGEGEGQIDHFDIIAGVYDRFASKLPRTDLAELLCAGAGELVLDVGGGTGRLAQALQKSGAWHVVVDRSAEMAKQAAAKGLCAVIGSASALPFAARSVPKIVVVDAFHHFVSPSQELGQSTAARELTRVLSSGGRLVIEEPDIRRFVVKLIALGEWLLGMNSRILAPAGMEALFQRIGGAKMHLRLQGVSYQAVFGSVQDEGAAQGTG